MTKEICLERLQQVIDPELSYSVVDLGLIYDVDISDNDVTVDMTLTTPFCPYVTELMQQIKERLSDSDKYDVKINLVWDPPWNPAKMASDAVKDALGLW